MSEHAYLIFHLKNRLTHASISHHRSTVHLSTSKEPSFLIIDNHGRQRIPRILQCAVSTAARPAIPAAISAAATTARLRSTLWWPASRLYPVRLSSSSTAMTALAHNNLDHSRPTTTVIRPISLCRKTTRTASRDRDPKAALKVASPSCAAALSRKRAANALRIAVNAA